MSKYKKIQITLGQYSIWFGVNFFLCLLPIIANYIIGIDKDKIFLSFLSYSYTLLISSYYLFDASIFIKTNQSDNRLPSVIGWWTLFFAFFNLMFLAIYPQIPEKLREFLSSSFITYIILTALLMFFSLLLTKNGIKDYVEKISADQSHEKSKRISKKVKNMKAKV